MDDVVIRCQSCGAIHRTHPNYSWVGIGCSQCGHYMTRAEVLDEEDVVDLLFEASGKVDDLTRRMKTLRKGLSLIPGTEHLGPGMIPYQNRWGHWIWRCMDQPEDRGWPGVKPPDGAVPAYDDLVGWYWTSNE